MSRLLQVFNELRGISLAESVDTLLQLFEQVTLIALDCLAVRVKVLLVQKL